MGRTGIPAAMVPGLLTAPAVAEARDDATIAACLARTEAGAGDPHTCIDSGRDSSTAAMAACCRGEAEAWDVRLNADYRKVMSRLPPDSVRLLRDAQRSWLETHQLSCGFYEVFYDGGTMARPVIAASHNRVTAGRALYLKGFADEMDDRQPLAGAWRRASWRPSFSAAGPCEA